MKNIVQARKKGSSARPGRQAHPQTERTVTVAFFSPNVAFDSDDESLIARVQLPAAVFKRVQSAAKKTGVSLDEFFNQAFQSQLTRDGVITSAVDLNGGAR